MTTIFKTSKKSKINFIATPHGVGSTYTLDDDNDLNKNYSFGCPRYFFRFNFTSALQNMAMAYVDWCSFLKSSSNTFKYGCYMGRVSHEEWNTGPKYNASFCPFIPLRDICPSRFVLAYRPNLDIAFIALDGERLVGDRFRVPIDVGDNKTKYSCSYFDDGEDCSVSNQMHRFLNLSL